MTSRKNSQRFEGIVVFLCLAALLCGTTGCFQLVKNVREFFDPDDFSRGDWYLELTGGYQLDQVNSNCIVLEKKDAKLGEQTVIQNYYVTRYCVEWPYICVEGIPTKDPFITDEEKRNYDVTYYVVDTERDIIEGPFQTLSEMQEHFGYLFIPSLDVWPEAKRPS